MSPAKSFSVEKRITRSAARIILNEKSNQTSSSVIDMESQLNDHVIDTKGKRMKKAQLVPAASEFESGMCIAHDWYLSVGVIHFFSLSSIGLIQAESLLDAKVANVTPSPSSQPSHSSVLNHSRSIVTSPAASMSNTSSISARMLSDISNNYDLHDHGANQDEKEEHGGDTNQDKTDENHYQETYPIAVGPITWGKTKLGGDMLFMEESIYVFQSKSNKLNKTLWRCQRREKSVAQRLSWQ